MPILGDVATEVSDRLDETVDDAHAGTSESTAYDAPYAEATAVLEARARLSDSGSWIDHHLLTILSVSAALPALRAPVTWLTLCAVAALVMLAVASVNGSRAKQRGSADVVVVPTRVVGRALLALVNPVSWLTVILGAVVALVAGALVAGALAALRWLAIEGTTGILAAVRAGVWAHAPRVAAVVGCFLLLRAGGRTAERRAAALRSRTRRLSEPLLAAVVVVVVTASVAFALAGPRLDPAAVHRADGLGWLPPGLRMPVDGARDDLVAAELDAVTACLDGDETGLWTAGYTAGNSLDDADVATLVADPARAPDEPALAAAALAADNHLAPWVELIELRVGDDVVLTVDRRGHAHHQPSTDADALRAAAVATPEWLTTVAPHVDAARVLRCSARTPL